jgi:hypothetical protein
MRSNASTAIKALAFGRIIELWEDNMKFPNQILRVLPVVMLGCSLLPAPAQAQFSQQAKLVGTGVVGIASQGDSVSLSADGNTAIVTIVSGDVGKFFGQSGGFFVG